jgi:hypothetical protein
VTIFKNSVLVVLDANGNFSNPRLTSGGAFPVALAGAADLIFLSALSDAINVGAYTPLMAFTAIVQSYSTVGFGVVNLGAADIDFIMDVSPDGVHEDIANETRWTCPAGKAASLFLPNKPAFPYYSLAAVSQGAAGNVKWAWIACP